MSVDINSLLGIASGIKVAKADYDFARDGGAVGGVPLASEIVPLGSIVLGQAVYMDTTLVFSGGGSMSVFLGADQLYLPGITTGQIETDLITGDVAPITDADRPITAKVVTGACTAGKWHMWVLYLPAPA